MKRVRSLTATATDYQRLTNETGVPTPVLQRCGVKPSATSARALQIVKGRVGAVAWAAAEVATSLPGRGAVLLAALADCPAKPAADDASAEGECAGCGHDADEHEPECEHEGCDCEHFEGEEESADEAKPAAKAAKSPAARIAAAVNHPSVIRMFNAPGNEHPIEKIAAAWIENGGAGAPAKSAAQASADNARGAGEDANGTSAAVRAAMQDPVVRAAAARNNKQLEPFARAWVAALQGAKS